MTMPVRIQLSRRKGFDLQEASRALNGLEAINVARPSKWGNPYRIIPGDGVWHLTRPQSEQIFCSLPTEIEAANTAAFQYQLWLQAWPEQREFFARHEREINGRNLACWCALDAPCHADVLLRLANVRSDEPSPTPSAESAVPEDHPRSPLAEAPSRTRSAQSSLEKPDDRHHD